MQNANSTAKTELSLEVGQAFVESFELSLKELTSINNYQLIEEIYKVCEKYF